MNIIIYGDSYGSDYQNPHTWPNLLPELINKKIINNAVPGEGPTTTMNKFLDDFSKQKYSRDSEYIILLSDPTRMDYPFLREKYHACNAFEISSKNIPPPEETQYLLNYHYELQTISHSLGSFFIYENIKNVLLLKLISDTYNLKILTFMCFNYSKIEKYFGVSKSKNILENLNFSKIKSDNFYFFEIPLVDICGDYRYHICNHMSIEVNKKFAKLVKNLLYNEPYDNSWFEKDENNDPYANFIYH